MAAPVAVKQLLPYITLADEAAQGGQPGPLLAYYIRMYVAERGVAAHTACTDAERPAVENMLGPLMDQIGQTKGELGVNSSTEASDIEQVKHGAVATFAEAYKADKVGAATKETIIQYRRAGYLFDVVRMFLRGTVDTKVENMTKYAKFRAVNILKDLQAGRQPLPPGGPDMTTLDAELEGLGGVISGGPANAYFSMPGAGASGAPASWSQTPVHSYPSSFPTMPTGMPPPDETMGGAGGGFSKPQQQTDISQVGGTVYGGQGYPPMQGMPSASNGVQTGYALGRGVGGVQQPYQQQQQQGPGGGGPSFLGGLASMVGMNSSSNSGIVSSPVSPPGTDAAFKDAAELTKFALAALKERNSERAANFLTQALNTLSPGTVPR